MSQEGISSTELVPTQSVCKTWYLGFTLCSTAERSWPILERGNSKGRGVVSVLDSCTPHRRANCILLRSQFLLPADIRRLRTLCSLLQSSVPVPVGHHIAPPYWCRNRKPSTYSSHHVLEFTEQPDGPK